MKTEDNGTQKKKTDQQPVLVNPDIDCKSLLELEKYRNTHTLKAAGVKVLSVTFHQKLDSVTQRGYLSVFVEKFAKKYFLRRKRQAKSVKKDQSLINIQK